uniref:Retrotransposon protein n=1 Tax=Steinernema glaseri TaxID=37863 RepID=A0A1I7Y3P1_9BILA
MAVAFKAGPWTWGWKTAEEEFNRVEHRIYGMLWMEVLSKHIEYSKNELRYTCRDPAFEDNAKHDDVHGVAASLASTRGPRPPLTPLDGVKGAPKRRRPGDNTEFSVRPCPNLQQRAPRIDANHVSMKAIGRKGSLCVAHKKKDKATLGEIATDTTAGR